MCVCVSLCTTVVQNTALNSSDNLPSYPPDNHHSSDAVYWRGAGETLSNRPTTTRWSHPFPTDSSLGWQCWRNGKTAVECTVSRMFLPWVVRRVWTGSALICGTVRIVRRSTVWTHDHRHSATSCAASQNHITPTVTYHHTLVMLFTPLQKIFNNDQQNIFVITTVATRAVQPVSTRHQSPHLHKPAIVIATSFALWWRSRCSQPPFSLWHHSHCDVIATQLATPTVTDVRTPYRI